MRKLFSIYSLVATFLFFPIYIAHSLDFSGNASIETAYDTNIEGISDHSFGGEGKMPEEDFLTIASLFLNAANDKEKKIRLNFSLNEIYKLYYDEYTEDSNRHIGEINISIPISQEASFDMNNRSIFHFQPKEDIRNFFGNYSTFSLSYQLNDKNSLTLGYMNSLKKYPNNNKWNFTKSSFFIQAAHHFSNSLWITASYEGVLYRGRNNFYYEKEEEDEEDISSIFSKKTSKGNEHRLIFSGNKIFENGSAISLKYRFVSNSVNEVIDVEEDRELAEFEGPFAYENDEQDFNYTLNEATMIFSFPILKRMALDIILLYQFQNFDGDAFPLEDKRSRRLDRLAVADITLTINILDNLDIKIRNAEMCNESNYPEREYERNYTSIALTYFF